MVVLGVAAALVIAELSSPCPPGGPLAFGSCQSLRPTVIGVVVLGAMLYVAALSAVLAWVGGLRRRRVADARSTRDWYLLTAVIGLPIALPLAFVILSSLR